MGMPDNNAGRFLDRPAHGLTMMIWEGKNGWRLMVSPAPYTMTEALRPPWRAVFRLGDLEPPKTDTAESNFVAMANLLASIAEGDMEPDDLLP